ncbi:DUF3019 domain-containing protein [Shewanella sp. AS16]|uniref:DUF3019 domain-containing protein n=1 Tax=Shewanella sp. AS16 TaxID=2907625 RepID=UPI001F473B38|nr:DUF3019 domain-containing protein [Shewanella sp. AS16]MCE9685400.1 DUF3019 domain-containing protein [Shewanella sp. AS16]
MTRSTHYIRFGILCWLLAMALHGEALAADKPRLARLNLTPEQCITQTKAQSCDVEITLQWQLAHEELICIISDYGARQHWCNDSPEVDRLTLQIETRKDIHFVMISQATHKTLAKAQLTVSSVAAPQVRRRYRNPWSVF